MAKVKSVPLCIVIPNQPESANVILRKHWAIRRRANVKIQCDIFALLWEAGWRGNWPFCKKVGVVIQNWKGDPDNAIGGCKGIIDALTKGGIIIDDNPNACQIDYRFEKGEGKKKAVKVLLYYPEEGQDGIRHNQNA